VKPKINQEKNEVSMRIQAFEWFKQQFLNIFFSSLRMDSIQFLLLSILVFLLLLLFLLCSPVSPSFSSPIPPPSLVLLFHK
jgi:hypothetical protein